jgi:hypothetical protein
MRGRRSTAGSSSSSSSNKMSIPYITASSGPVRISRRREDVGYSRTVAYNTRNHWSLIAQRWGSINTKIIPFLLVNAALATAVLLLQQVYGIDLTISEFGHEFMSVLLAFLVINKLQFTLEVYVCKCLLFFSLSRIL